MKRFLSILAVLMLLVGCDTDTAKPSPSPSTDTDMNACVFGEDCDSDDDTPASSLMDWPVIEFADSLDYVDDTAILFYSFDDCPYCKEAIPVLDELVKDSDVKIYYVHTSRDQRTEGDSDYDRVYAYFKDTIEEAGYDKLYMPSVFFIKDGEVVAYHVATVESHDPSVAKMTDEEVQELKNIYQNAIDLLVD